MNSLQLDPLCSLSHYGDRSIQGRDVHHSRLEELIILGPSLVQGKEEDDQRNKQTHYHLEYGPQHSTGVSRVSMQRFLTLHKHTSKIQ